MTKKKLTFFKKLINQKITELRVDIKSFAQSSCDESRELSHLSQHAGDTASMNMDINQNLKLADREGVFLTYLEDALFRIEEGIFGQCSVCENLISEERLKVVPVAKMCITCKQEKERKHR